MNIPFFKNNKKEYTFSVSTTEDPNVKSLIPKQNRIIPREKLQELYIRDSLLSGWITTRKDLMLGSGYRFSGENGEKLSNWLKNINFDNLLSLCARDADIYGEFYLEKVMSAKVPGRVVGLLWIDAKTIDYKKDSEGKIIYDEYQNPIGYEQKTNTFGDKAKFKPEEIIHYIQNPLRNKFIGTGIIEPVYTIGKAKVEIIKALAHNIYRHAFPINVIQHGTPEHPPIGQEYKSVDTALTNIDSKSELNVPYWIKIYQLEPKSIQNVQEVLKFFNTEELVGLGLSREWIYGENANKSTLNQKTRTIKTGLIRKQKMFSTVFYNQLFKDIAKQEGWLDVPEMLWNPIDIEDINAKAKRINEYIKNGVISPEEIKESVNRIEELK